MNNDLARDIEVERERREKAEAEWVTFVVALEDLVREWSRRATSLDYTQKQSEAYSHCVASMTYALRAYARMREGAEAPVQWWGVWAEQRGTERHHWHQHHFGEDTQTTETEARRLAGALNEFANDRTDSLGWTYEARLYVKPGAKESEGMSNEWKPPIERPLRGVQSHYVQDATGRVQVWAGSGEMATMTRNEAGRHGGAQSDLGRRIG